MPRIKVLVLVNVSKIKLRPEQLVLQVTKNLPTNLVTNALAVLEANREYQERALARDGLKRMYIGTLTLTLFLAVFGAVLLAAILGNQLAKPLLVLAMGVRDVAAGDLSPKEVLEGRDELDGLTRAFAQMTEQLANSRSDVQNSMNQVSLARANLQTILDNLTAGVIVIKPSGQILSANPGANRILKVNLNKDTAGNLGNGSNEIDVVSGASGAFGVNLKEIPTISAFVVPVVQQFENFVGDQINQELDHWQDSFEFVPPGIEEGGPGILGDKTGVVTLVARGAVLPNGDWLLVFDDISQIISAQRTQAWGEVAKRLAHEIKNPLTPIQLSAERLASKLQGKVDAADQNLLNKSVKTIVDQVDAMKRLVNEFREFGRMPQADLRPLDLNSLIKEVLSLYEAENNGVIIKSTFDAQCPNILGDEQLLRQVIHNLLQNAQDSIESLDRREIVVETEWRERSKRVRMSVSDSGTGFTEAVLQRAFEPYVTTKAKGTGLGLAVVKKIADEHNARIELRNIEDRGEITGARVAISFQSEKIGSVNMTQIEKA